MAKRLTYVRLTKIRCTHNAPNVDGFAASNAFDAALTVVDLSRVIESPRLGILESLTMDIFVLPRGQHEPSVDARPTATCGVQRFEEIRAFAKGFDAGRAA